LHGSPIVVLQEVWLGTRSDGLQSASGAFPVVCYVLRQIVLKGRNLEAVTANHDGCTGDVAGHERLSLTGTPFSLALASFVVLRQWLVRWEFGSSAAVAMRLLEDVAGDTSDSLTEVPPGVPLSSRA
jgi:hypothetical protein